MKLNPEYPYIRIEYSNAFPQRSSYARATAARVVDGGNCAFKHRYEGKIVWYEGQAITIEYKDEIYQHFIKDTQIVCVLEPARSEAELLETS